MRACFVMATLLLVSFTAKAQFTATGSVQDADGEPLIGVTVLVKGTANGTVTDFDGNFSISVPGESGTLEISYVGFATIDQDVASGGGSVTIVLSDEATQLDAVVVSGLATNVKRSNLANSVASIPGKEISGIAVPTTTDAALYGKFKGANITTNSGAPGGGIGIKLRGQTSISGSSQPLFIMDGVFLNNSSIPAGLNVVSQASGGGSQSNQDNPSNRLADIDPNDIESIEILKGASAAAIYGSRASGGVIIITTKKGKPGKTDVRLSQSLGWTEMLNPLGQREWTAERVANSSRYADDVDAFNAAQSAGNIQNYEDLLYGNMGILSNTRLSISGGNEKTSFFIGGTLKDDEGIVENTGYQKASVRVNVDHQIADWLDLSTSTNYVNSSADRGFFNNDNSGTTMGVSFSATPAWAQLLPDDNGIYPENPYSASNFLETANTITNNETVNRVIAGATATASIVSSDYTSLKLIARGGIDYFNLKTEAIFPNSLQFMKPENGGLNGVSVQGSTFSLNTNLESYLVWSQYTASGLSFRTQAGVQVLNFDQNTILGETANLITGQTNLDQGGSRNVTQVRQIQQDKGFFVQEEVNFKDQIIVTVGIRGDKSSNNGDVNQLFYYPKASAALNLHEFGFLPSTLSHLKARVAYGQSGNFARFGAKFTTLNSTIISGSPGVEIDNLLGNPDVGPERQSELEFGVDLGFSNDRVFFDATYYIKTVDDLLLNADVPSSAGFISKVTNAAALENRGIELGLAADIVRTEDVNWYGRLSWWNNRATVTRLDVPTFTTGGFADFLGQFRIKEGRSPTEIIGVGPEEMQDEDGLVVYGDATPDFQMSFYNGLSWKSLELNFLLHWKQGGENINLSTLLFDLNETTHDYDDIDLDPDGALGNGDYRLSLLGVNTGPYIEDATYLRLREIGIYYSLPRDWFNDVVGLRVGFSGTNLINIFTYNSYDPEVSNFGSNGLSTGVEVLPFPTSKRFEFHLSASF